MKSVKNHLMFIFPLVAILLGIEFYMVFERITGEYEKRLQQGYAMLVVASKPVDVKTFRKANSTIVKAVPLPRDKVAQEVVNEFRMAKKEAIEGLLPYFYDVSMNKVLSVDELEQIRNDLLAVEGVMRVETFGSAYASSYRLFYFIKLLLKIFIGFLAIVSLLLIVKQVEVWKYAHRERMQVMEIFGAPLMLRAGVLFRIAIVDAFIATLITAGVFLYAKTVWAPRSGIDFIYQKQDELFAVVDMGLLLSLALVIVIAAVYMVVISNTKGIER